MLGTFRCHFALMYKVPAVWMGAGLQGLDAEKRMQTPGKPEDLVLTRGKVRLSTQC